VIETVLGPLPADRLGPTSMHEHLLSDASALEIPQDPAGPEEDVVLEDSELAAAELHRTAGAWRASSPDLIASESGDEARPSIVVDPTVWGFGGPAPGLAEIARASGVAIVAGVGAYIPRTRPEWLNEMDEGALTDHFRGALLDHLPGCPFRAGIVGMLAPGLPLPPRLSPTGRQAWERAGSAAPGGLAGADLVSPGGRASETEEGDRRVLRAGAAAAAETGSAAIVRLDPRRRDGLEVLETMTAAGLAADRVVFSNVDGYARDLGALRELAEAGATLKWCFGYEAPPRPGLATATDAERADAVAALLAAGHHRQVLACGIWTKAALHAHGGWGYDHLPRSVVPALRARGLTDSDLSALLVSEPRRLLDRPPVEARSS
jgi:phosphotriesterase-related protein